MEATLEIMRRWSGTNIDSSSFQALLSLLPHAYEDICQRAEAADKAALHSAEATPRAAPRPRQ